MTDYLPAGDIDPGWQVWQPDHDRWITVEVAVQIRRADGTTRVSWLIAEDAEAVEAEAGDMFTVRWESNETD